MKYLEYFKESKTSNNWTINDEHFNGGLQLFLDDIFYKEFVQYEKFIQVQIDSFDKEMDGGNVWFCVYLKYYIKEDALFIYLSEDLKSITDEIEYDDEQDEYSFNVSENILNRYLSKIEKFYECNKYFMEIQKQFDDGDKEEWENINEFELLMQQFEITTKEYQILTEPLIHNYNEITNIEHIDEFVDAVEKIKNHKDIDTFLNGKDMGLL